ncbi:serine/threonine protein phosphatase [Micrococcus terreus]|uniref:serine/threonine protein phosphatase n=1 Tax=Micrococcus terreus TaxID=574650 RepID=UPI0021A83B56|nr:serine/threonine protein phosphatase [Micrococcus terreus]MCT2088473.1 serine/threonine protein phosphatase [Micrococcus terreus]MDK7700106.1 serine/threonine protein phosphatase [Micrococcus terreus]WOO97035.1 serine/threonine protein phosphatase [Micrococcus terreus]
METTFDHVRPFDGEHVGYIEISGDLFVPYDRMWQRRGEAMPLDEAEAILDSTGLSMLAEDWLLADDASENGAATRVRIQEITRDTVTVAPTVDSMSAEVAKSLDLTRTLRLDLPTDRLRLADPRP